MIDNPPTLGTRVRACKDREVDVIPFACLFLHRGSFSDGAALPPGNAHPGNWETMHGNWETVPVNFHTQTHAP
jgi:hypothetical protein